MALAAGIKLGPYEVVSPLGAGGMGEVYRARDTKLGREVALKVISPEFAHDAERMARFQREAQVLASLNHPHIAAIYGFEESAGVRALVMEIVEGPTLAERIKEGAIPVEEALPIARQIAEALEYAHERGIVHRDLKPANVKLTRDGKVKVLDFGLAKALQDGSSAGDISNSPTLTMASTKEGIILGTAAYMSPEQAKGKAADRRSDIWSFGVVLFEMLSGQQTFGGETVSDALAAIIKDSPDWTQLPAATPARIRGLLRRCLQKDPRQRLQAIGEARIAIEEALSGAGQEAAAVSAVAVAAPPSVAPLWKRLAPWALAAVLGAGLVASLIALRQPASPSAARLVQLSLGMPPGQQFVTENGPAVAISPDGSRVAYVIRDRDSGVGRLYMREMDQGNALLLDGAGFAADPFFSPDSQWIGFFGEGKLKKISVRGGAAVDVTEADGYRGGAWSQDGTIVFPELFTSPLYRVPAAGGKAEAVTQLDAGRVETTHRWPQFLPDGKTVIYTASADNNFFGHASVKATRLDTGKTESLVENAYFGRYLTGGYLAYVSQGTVFATPFDAKTLRVTGTAIPVLQGVVSDISNGGAQLSISDNGTAVYLTGDAVNQPMNIVLVDRKGAATVLVANQSDASSPSISPDGKRVAFQNGSGIWVHDLARGTTTPITPGVPKVTRPVWTPDGQRLAYSHPYSSSKNSGERIYWRRADGSGEEEALTPADLLHASPASWSPDGKTLAFYGFWPKDGSCCEIWTLKIDENGKPAEPQPFFDGNGGAAVFMPAFSPDGRWLAYTAEQGGLPQIFVVPFPGPGGRWQISTEGGEQPQWSKSGHELFYMRAESLVAVPYSAEKDSFQAGKPEVLFAGRFEARAPYTSYDVMPDGQHFVMFQFAGARASEASEPTVVLNWLDEVRRTVDAGQGSTSR
ncbi:MAG: protein kinase [Candidatus Acidiferrales bacterium]